MKIKEIPIKKIKIKENHRVDIEKTKLDELMQSIKQRGLLQPIGVIEKKNGSYWLRFGQRRLLACQKLGYKTIDCDVVKKITSERMLLENLTENMQRIDPSFAEIGRIIHRLQDDFKMTLQQIAVRLGITYRKVKQIYDVYAEFPEEYRKKIAFMVPGCGRKKKSDALPAQVATKIIRMKKHHGLTKKSMEKIFDATLHDGLDAVDLCSVGELITSGMSAEDALKNIREYGTFNVDIVAKHSEIGDMMDKYGLISRKHLFKKVLYGEIPPLKKPYFVSSGIFVKTKKEEKQDLKKYKKIRDKLFKMRSAGKLTETQALALKSIEKVPMKSLTQEQCDQLVEIYKKVNE